MNKPFNDINPLTLEVVRHSLVAITDELETNLARTAFSPLIYEYKDFAVGLLDVDANVIVQGAGGLPIFLADLGGPLRDCIEVLGGLANIHPGDAILHNYAPVCGQHLNNVNLYSPVYSEGELVAFVGVRIHCADLGGKDMGSAGTDTTDIFQEGIQYRALKICKRGEIDPEIMRVVECNTRLPDIVRGDLMAQIIGCRTGEERLGELIAKFGWTTVRACIERIWSESEQLARAVVASMPDGVYVAETFLDDDGISLDVPLRVKATVTVAGEQMTIDLSEMNPQVQGPFNSGAEGGGRSAAKVAFKLVTTGSRPTDEGAFRNLNIVLPEGTFVSAGPTAPLGRWSTPLATVCDTILKACGLAVPERAIAGHHAQIAMYSISGKLPGSNRPFKHLDTAHGGWGARAGSDGFGPAKTIIHGDNRDIPIEIQEALYPLRVERYELTQDSAGAGTHRGCPGVYREYSVLSDARMTAMMERTRIAPWGIFGGCDGVPGHIEIARPTEAPFVANKITNVALPAGTRVTFRTSGGGGYGPPHKRPAELVREDVLQGLVSREKAQQAYGVVLAGADYQVDEAATRQLRCTAGAMTD